MKNHISSGKPSRKKQKLTLLESEHKNPSYLNQPPMPFNFENSDYFIRYRYNIEEVFTILRAADGKSLFENREAYDLLIDFGYWEYLIETNEEFKIASSPVFTWTESLKNRIQLHFSYLQSIFRNYEPKENIWFKNLQTGNMEEGQIKEHLSYLGTDFYVVNNNENTSVAIFTLNELNQWNSPTATLPQDEVLEKIDWDKDHFWQKKLYEFKKLIKAKHLFIDFNQNSDEIMARQKQIVSLLLEFFELKSGLVLQSNRGIGVRSCGGVESTNHKNLDQAVIYMLAVQAIGHTIGIKSVLLPNHHFRIEIKNKETHQNQILFQLNLLNRTEASQETNEGQVMRSLSNLQDVAECLLAMGPLFQDQRQNTLQLSDTVRKAMVEVYQEQKSKGKIFALDEAILSQQNELTLSRTVFL